MRSTTKSERFLRKIVCLFAITVASQLAIAEKNSDATSGQTLTCNIAMNDEIKDPVAPIGPMRSVIELLSEFRKIHENFALLNPHFATDKNIHYLFGDGSISNSKWNDPLIVSKRMVTDPRNDLYVKFLVWYSTIENEGNEGVSGLINLTPQKEESLYTAELIEKYLVPGIEGHDVLRETALNLPDIHAREAYHNRPVATHPKGYFSYRAINESRCYRSILNIRLNKSGRLLDIDIEQKGK